MKHLKYFESIRDEFPGMFEPRKEIKSVPGFEDGTIDPDDDYVYDGMSDKERYKDFLKIVKERNIQEAETETIINIKGLFEDFYMSIQHHNKHLKILLEDEILGKYISDGFINYMTNKKQQGIIEKIYVDSDEYTPMINFKLNNRPHLDSTMCQNTIILDKIKTATNKYNL